MALAMRESRTRRGRWLLTGGLASLAVAGTSWTELAAPGWSETFLLVAVALLLAAVFQGGWGFVREMRIRDPEGAPRGDVLEGKLIATERLQAPGTHASVVGYRLVGDSVRGPIDDAALAPFTLATDDGRRVEVDPTHAMLDVPVSPLNDQLEPVDRDAVWQWGGDPSNRPWQLGTVGDGARVQVTGTVEDGRVRGSTGQPVRVKIIPPNQKRS